MGRKKLTPAEKGRALALLEGVSVIRTASDIGVTRRVIYNLKKAAACIPPGTVPGRKHVSGRKRKTTARTDTLLKREVMTNPDITAKELKKKYQDLLQEVAVRTIQPPPKGFGPAISPRSQETLTYQASDEETPSFLSQVRILNPRTVAEVTFSDESPFRLVFGTAKHVRRPKSVSRYYSHYTIKTVKHSESVMVWGAFTGNVGRAGLHFLSKGQTVNGTHFMDVLKEHLPLFYELHECAYFMQDSVPAHRTKQAS